MNKIRPSLITALTRSAINKTKGKNKQQNKKTKIFSTAKIQHLNLKAR